MAWERMNVFTCEQINTTLGMDDRGASSSPLLWAGAPNVLALARRRRSDGAHLIVLTVQRASNAKSNLGGLDTRTKERKCRVLLPGVGAVELAARPQGSVYVRLANGTVEQLDKWHEAGHPLTWAGAGGTRRA